MRSALLLAAVVVLLAGGGVVLLRGGGGTGAGAGGGAVPSPGFPPALEAVPAPETLPLRELEAFGGGGSVDLAGYVGQPLVVNFWASWCGPCVAEMPDLQRLSEELAGEVVLLGVNTRDIPSAAAELAAQTRITYDLAVDRDASYFNELRAFGMPTTLFVRADGSIAWRQTGPLTYDEARALVTEHFGV